MISETLTQITWPEVRKGDVLLHEDGDRLTVEVAHTSEGSVFTSGIWRSVAHLAHVGFTPYRKQSELPTEPGAYLDRDGEFWLLRDDEGGIFSTPWFSDRTEVWVSRTRAAHFAPFTRLVPMPTEEQIEEALLPTLRKVVDGRNWLRRDFTDAVMALLGGGDDD